MTVVKRRGGKKPVLDMAKVVSTFQEFRKGKTQESAGKTLAEAKRDELMPLLESFGVAHGETGAHQAIELPEAIDGFVRIVRRKNVSSFFDLDRAEKLAADKGVLDDVQTTTITLSFSGSAAEAQRVMDALEDGKLEAMGATVRADVHIDQDKVYALHQKDRDLITEAELDACLVEDVKHSFFPEK